MHVCYDCCRSTAFPQLLSPLSEGVASISLSMVVLPSRRYNMGHIRLLAQLSSPLPEALGSTSVGSGTLTAQCRRCCSPSAVVVAPQGAGPKKLLYTVMLSGRRYIMRYTGCCLRCRGRSEGWPLRWSARARCPQLQLLCCPPSHCRRSARCRPRSRQVWPRPPCDRCMRHDIMLLLSCCRRSPRAWPPRRPARAPRPATGTPARCAPAASASRRPPG